jgi:hypothetical protein
LSEDFKEKLKAYAEGRLSEDDKLLMERELEKLEIYQEFLDEQMKESSNKPSSEKNIVKNQDKIIMKSKWKARLQNACITWILFCILLLTSQALTSRYYKAGKPNKINLYTNAMRAAIETTRPNAYVHGSTGRPGMLFSREIGIQYSKKVGREEIRGGYVNLKFRFSRPSIVTDVKPDSLSFGNFYFDPSPYNSEYINLNLDSTMWKTLEKLPEGTVAEAYISFKELYETEEVFSIFKDKDMELLWLAVDTGVSKDNRNTVLGFPHTERFEELRRNWFDPPPKHVEHYTNGEFRNEYFIDTLKFLNEYKAITNAVDSIGSMPNIEEALSYVNKNGVKIFGVAITGPTKEILKLREEGFVKRVIVGETRLWNWD